MNTDDMFERAVTVKFHDAEVILRQEDLTAWVYKIRTGMVREFVLSQEGIEITLTYHTRGSIFPLSSLSGGQLLASGFQSHGETTLARIPEADFKKHVDGNAGELQRIATSAIDGQRTLIRRMGCLVFCHAYTRVIDSIVYLANHFGKPAGKSRILVAGQFTQKDIAAIAGVTRETASTEIGRLIERGLIRYQGKTIEVSDMGRLHREIEEHKERK